jgi:hypothetical protein
MTMNIRKLYKRQFKGVETLNQITRKVTAHLQEDLEAVCGKESKLRPRFFRCQSGFLAFTEEESRSSVLRIRRRHTRIWLMERCQRPKKSQAGWAPAWEELHRTFCRSKYRSVG